MVTDELDCLREVRAELSSTYPRVRPIRVLRILHRYRMRRLPRGLLLDARILSPGPRGALAMLYRAGRPRLGRRLLWHPLFSEDFYLGTNPDVVQAGANAWLHYQVFGRAEGRSPHPLIDVAYLSSAIVPSRRDEVVDRYVTDPRVWDVDPSPYVEGARFLLDGPWDGTTHPLSQIVLHHSVGPWINHRLMIVDVGSLDDARSHLVGAAILLAARGATTPGGPARLWRPGSEWISSGTATIAPGLFLGADGREVYAAPGWVLSEDRSIVAVAGGHLVIPAGGEHKVDVLAVLFGELNREYLATLTEGSETVAVAPNSPQQRDVLAELFRRRSNVIVLDHGRQVRVDAGRIVGVHGDERRIDLRVWDPFLGDPAATAFVLPREHHRRAARDEQLVSWIERGAALCLLGDEGFEPWRSVLSSRSTLVVDRSLSDVAQNVLGEQEILLLPSGESRGRA